MPAALQQEHRGICGRPTKALVALGKGEVLAAVERSSLSSQEDNGSDNDGGTHRNDTPMVRLPEELRDDLQISLMTVDLFQSA
ncbi:hypothetical protein NDU88_001866 [Pleurodeles waltl]|uniref:Uncharacterized protein n=1 Tax=Pleurodeles waltl TaxID=8319 RepID=A0AAV7KZQ1_PLEWA|nr:hypothetical protein NDU88_001866 [Pleurodeles waltl]